MFLSRRALLLGGLSVGALGASFGVSTLLPANGCRVLSKQEHEIVQAIAQAMFPKTDDLAGADELDIAGEVDRILADVLDDPAVIGFRAVLRSLEWGSYASRARRFSRLEVRQRREILDVWGSPGVLPRLTAAASLKAVLGMAYFGQDEVRTALGWRAVCGSLSS